MNFNFQVNNCNTFREILSYSNIINTKTFKIGSNYLKQYP